MIDNNKIKVLDHGFVQLRNLSGPIRRIEQTGIVEGQEVIGIRDFDADDIDAAITARISFNKGEVKRARELDLNLVRYLLANKHNTPIEMVETWWEMKLPIFLARQFVRHRTACINEVSARYATLPEEWYIPEVIGGKATSNKQGQEDNLSSYIQERVKDSLHSTCARSYRNYQDCLKEGVAPEHARLFLHVNHYINWVFKIDLSNLMHLLALRLDSHAQVEARVYAQAMYDLLAQYLPNTMQLFDTYKRTLSEDEKKLLKSVLDKGIGLSDFNTKEAETIARIYERLTKGTI